MDLSKLLISHAEIVRAYRLNACHPALAWLHAAPRTWKELAEWDPTWYLWAVARGGPPDLVDECAAKEPRAALALAPAELSPARLDWCAERCPTTALREVPHSLTPARLDRCAEQSPSWALWYASDLLTPERRATCRAACEGPKEFNGLRLARAEAAL